MFEDNEMIKKKDLMDTLVWVAETWPKKYVGKEDELFDDLIAYLLYRIGYQFSNVSYTPGYKNIAFTPCDEIKDAAPQFRQFETYMML